MAFGVSALTCRLDAGTVDWSDLVGWVGVRPAFAGKYLIASPWRWVHGEGTALVDPAVAGASLAVAPIQASDAVRQAEPAELGQQWGGEDGSALAAAVQGALDVGDLAYKAGQQRIYVYLEVDAHTALSADYWAGWAGAVSTAILCGTQPIAGFDLPVIQGLLPCLATPFDASTEGAGHWVPPQAIRDALDGSAKIGWASARCYGFWAQTQEATIEAAPALDWSSFATYRQKQRSGPDVPVPVIVWRYATGDPAAPVHQVGKVTLEATQAVSGQPDLALDAMLSVQNWSATNWSTTAPPSMIGVDRGAPVRAEIRCLSTRKLTVSNMPEAELGNAGPALATPLKAPVSFVGRYYSAGPKADGSRPDRDPKDLSVVEAADFSQAGVDVVSFFQSRVPSYATTPAYLKVPANGYADGRAAGWFAATQAHQPAHTPIYFSVDCDVTTTGDSTNPNDSGAISDTQLTDYFSQVAHGLADYLAGQEKEARVPYAVGVYGCAHACDVLYPLGLASHFWQARPGLWGDTRPGQQSNIRVWARASIWQVSLDRNPTVQVASGLQACKRVFPWIFQFNDQRGPNAVNVTVGQTTKFLAFPPTQETLAAATGAKVVQVQIEPRVTSFRMEFATDPAGVAITSTGGESAGFRMRLDEIGLADLNVSWGDPGGWRAPRGGA